MYFFKGRWYIIVEHWCMSRHGNTLLNTVHLSSKSTGYQWIPLTKVSNAWVWCINCCKPEFAHTITCCICHSTHHMKCLSICPNELNALECNSPEWFCEICLSQQLVFNHIEENNDFYAAVHKLSKSTAEYLRYLSDKVFQPFESACTDYEE